MPGSTTRTSPTTSWDVKRYLFRPEVGCYGIQRIDALKDCLIVSGAGVGGGSLVYANTLYEPLPAFYNDPQWSHITDWRSELAPYYDQAKRMLGVVENPLRTPADDVMEQVADRDGRGRHVPPDPGRRVLRRPGRRAGRHGTVDDPYFGGAGPPRTTCIGCGECMSGCRHNAKNTLVKNYLYLAEQNGARVLPLTTVTRRRAAGRTGGGYDVHVRFTKAKTGRAVGDPGAAPPSRSCSPPPRWAPSGCCTGCATRATCRGSRDRLGFLSRTNSESILGAIAPDTRSTTARASRSPRASTPTPTPTSSRCRYGRGSNFMSLMQTVLTDGDGPTPRWRTWLREMWTQRRNVARPLRRQALVGAHRHRAGDAEPRQLDHHLHQADPRHPAPLPHLASRATACRTRPGSRRATTAVRG